MFKSLLAKVGVGGATVDTRLPSSPATPGSWVRAEVHVKGGAVDQDVGGISLSLCTRAKTEHDDVVTWHEVELARIPVCQPFQLKAGEAKAFPIDFILPLETPLTQWNGRAFSCKVYVRTHLDIVSALDANDADPLAVAPTPAQSAVLAACERLGLGLFKADIEMGQIPGSHLPCFQEIEFSTRGIYGSSVGEVEVTFLTRPGATRVILEIDRKARGAMSFFSSSHDDIVAFDVPDDEALHTDLATTIDSLIRSRLGSFRALNGFESRSY